VAPQEPGTGIGTGGRGRKPRKDQEEERQRHRKRDRDNGYSSYGVGKDKGGEGGSHHQDNLNLRHPMGFGYKFSALQGSSHSQRLLEYYVPPPSLLRDNDLS
jgi:hypothetical protein